MPGFLETTLHQGYGFLDPVLKKTHPYVEKARNAVPLIDQAAKKAEEMVPPLITRADELAEPNIEKLRPYVEPRIEQMRPYVDKGVEKCGVLCEEGAKYYHTGLDKVEQIKEFKDAKTTHINNFKDARVTQVKEFKEARTAQIREFAEPKVEKIKGAVEPKVAQIREFTDPKVEKIKEFKEAKTTQIREFTDPKVEKIKGAVEPKVTSGLEKIVSGVEKVEHLLDHYLPLSEDEMQDSFSSQRAHDGPSEKIKIGVRTIKRRLISVFMFKVRMILSLPMLLKSSYREGNLKEQAGSYFKDMKCSLMSKVDYAKSKAQTPLLTLKGFLATLKGDSLESISLRIKDKAVVGARELLEKASDKLAPAVKRLALTSVFKKAVQIAVAGSEKSFGKEKTTTILSKVEIYIPAAWKAAPPPAKKQN